MSDFYYYADDFSGFNVSYCPMPEKISGESKPMDFDVVSGEIKMKHYQKNETIGSVRAEFERLSMLKYTHVVNAPAKLEQVIPTARYFNIMCLDHRLVKYISDIASADTIDLQKN